jgi:acyl carrier protein
MPSAAADDLLKKEIKELIVTQLRLKDVTPEGIRDDESLVQGSLSLDSIDFLELTVAMEKKYGVKIAEGDDVQRIFASVNAIAGHILRQRAHPASA